MVHHVTTLKPYKCEYDRVRTLTVHHTHKRRTHQFKYDRVRTLTVHHTHKTKKRQCVYDQERTPVDTTETITVSTVARDKSLVPMSIITALGDSSRTTDSSPVERSRVRPPEIMVKHGGKRITHSHVCTKDARIIGTKYITL